MGSLWFETYRKRTAAAALLRSAGIRSLRLGQDLTRSGSGRPSFVIHSNNSTADMMAALEKPNGRRNGSSTKVDPRGRSTHSTVPRGGVCGAGRKPVSSITDRAKRYRANSPACRAELGPELCALCPEKGPGLEVHHKDGNEDNGAAGNLAWLCHRCNAWVASRHKLWGVGKRIDQRNAGGKKRGKRPAGMTIGKYGALMREMRGDGPGAKSAYAAIMALTHAERSKFNKELWAIRKERYGPSGRADQGSFWSDDAVPF